MVRNLLLVGVLAAAALVVGCGSKRSSLEYAAPSTPEDLGVPAEWSMGATLYKGRHFVVKTEVDGETRMWALSTNIIAQPGKYAQYDPKEKIFYDDRKRERTYTLDGTAIHSILAGPHKGEPAPSLRRKAIELDRETGHVLIYLWKTIDPEDINDPDEQAYIVVP